MIVGALRGKLILPAGGENIYVQLRTDCWQTDNIRIGTGENQGEHKNAKPAEGANITQPIQKITTGMSAGDGTSCKHEMAKSKGMAFQIWTCIHLLQFPSLSKYSQSSVLPLVAAQLY